MKCLTEYRDWAPQVEDVPKEVRKSDTAKDSMTKQIENNQVIVAIILFIDLFISDSLTITYLIITSLELFGTVTT